MSPEPHAVRWEPQAESQEMSVGNKPKQWETCIQYCDHANNVQTVDNHRLMPVTEKKNITSFTNSSSSSVCKE